MTTGGGDSTGNSDESVTAAAQAGDQDAFAALVERHRGELQVHCYRMLGSFDDAQDLVQETFLRAWRRRETFQGRSTFRAWLYRIATNACLDFLERHPRSPQPRQPAVAQDPGLVLAPAPEISWLQPYPDHLLELPAPASEYPDVALIDKETIELAFLAAIQHLPPSQRAILILRDVLGWSAQETAELLGLSVVAVKSALQRARGTLREQLPAQRLDWASHNPTLEERSLLQRYMDAHERGDASILADVLREDVLVSMPPLPIWFAGRNTVIDFHARVFDPSSPLYHGEWRSITTRANRQPAVAQYRRRPGDEHYRPQVLDVLRIEGGKIAEITGFRPELFAAFGLPETL